jgi:hypothetical protein
MHVTTTSLLSALFALATFAAPTVSRRETSTLAGLLSSPSGDYEELHISDPKCTVLERLTEPGRFAMYNPTVACRFYSYVPPPLNNTFHTYMYEYINAYIVGGLREETDSDC